MPEIFKSAAVALCFLSLTAGLPAMAQFEVAPDHFDTPVTPAPALAQARTELSAQIASQHRRLEALQAQLKKKAERVEELHEEAISAGIQGDGASGSIDAYRQEKKELDRLAQALTPEIEGIKANLTAPQELQESAATTLSVSRSNRSFKKTNIRPRKEISISQVR